MSKNLKILIGLKLLFVVICVSVILFSKTKRTQQFVPPSSYVLNEFNENKPKNQNPLNGLYRLTPRDENLTLDVQIDFRPHNVSNWITRIDDHTETIVKMYQIQGEYLYVHHDLEEFEKIKSKLRKEGKEFVVDFIEPLLNKVPSVDRYQIISTDTDTIQLLGDRLNFYLVKI